MLNSSKTGNSFKRHDLPEIPGLVWGELLGEGGFGAVYKAYDSVQKVELAVKKIRLEKTEYKNIKNPDWVNGFINNECKLWIDLEMHLNIVYCYYVKPIQGIPYIFMEYIPHGSMLYWIEQSKIRELPLLLQLAYQTAVGLHYIHSKGIIHQDIKPANILINLVDGMPVAKISDFTISVNTDSSGYGRFKGFSLPFASPEQIKQRGMLTGKLTSQSDMWNWAATILQMFTVSTPWIKGDNAPRSLEECYKNPYFIKMPPSLYQVLGNCFHDDPQMRPRTMLDVAEEIKEIYRQETGNSLREIQVDPSLLNAINYNNKGVSYWNIGSFQDSLNSFENALQSDPNYLPALFNLTYFQWIVSLTPNDTSFIKTIQNRLGNNAMDWYVYYLLGRAYMLSMHAEEAIEAFKKSYQLNPSYEQTVRLMNEAMESRDRFPRKIAELKGHTGYINCLAISADGKKAISSSGDKTIRVWDLEKKSCIAVIKNKDEDASAISISPSGLLAVFADYRGKISIWDLRKKKCILSMKAERKESERISISCISFLPNSDFVVSGEAFPMDKEACLRVWNIRTGICSQIIKAHTERVNSIVVSSDGKLVITSGNDNLAKIWRINTSGNILEFVTGFQGNRKYAESVDTANRRDRDIIRFADIDSKSKYLLAANHDSSINLYDISTNQLLETFYGHTETVDCVRWIPDSKFAISASRNELKVWDIQNRICLSTIQPEIQNPNFSLIWHPTFSFAPSCIKCVFDSDDDIHIFKAGDISSPRGAFIIEKIELAYEQLTISLQVREKISHVEELISRQEWEQAHLSLENIKKNYNEFKRHTRIRWLEGKIDEHAKRSGVKEIWLENTLTWQDKHFGSNLGGLDISKDNNTVIAASLDGVIFVLDIASKRISKILHSNNSIRDIKFIDKNRAISGGEVSGVDLWDLNMLERIDFFQVEDRFGGVSAVDYSEKFNWVMMGTSGLFGGRLVVFDLHSKNIIFEFKDEKSLMGGIHSVCFSSDGRLAMAGDSNGKIYLWGIAKGELIVTFHQHTGRVSFVCFFKSDTMAISVGSDNMVHIWDLKFGRVVKTIPYAPDKIRSVCISRDENYLILLSENNVIRLWNLNTYCSEHTYSPNIQVELSHIMMTDDAQHLIAGGQDRTVCIFGIDWIYEFPKNQPCEVLKEQPGILILPDKSEIQPLLGYGHNSDITALATVGIKYLLSGSFDNKIKVWDIFENGLCINTLAGHTDKINTILATSDQKEIISGGQDAAVIVWSFPSGIIKHTLRQDSAVYSLAVTSNKEYLICGCENGSIHIWEFQSGNRIKTIQLKSSVNSILITSNNRYLIAGTDQGEVAIWNMFFWDQVKTLHYSGKISKIQQEQHKIYIGIEAGNIEVIGLEGFEPVKRLSTQYKISDFYVRGSELVLCKFEFNDSLVAVIDLDTGETKRESESIGWTRVIASYGFGYCFVGLSKGNILLFNTSTGKVEGYIFGQYDHILCVKISSDRRYLISGYYDCFRIFDLHAGKLAEFENNNNIIDVDFTTDCKYAYAENYYGKLYQVDLSTMRIARQYDSSCMGNLNALTCTWGFNNHTFDHDSIFLSIRDEAGISFFKEVKEDEMASIQDSEVLDLLNKSGIRYMVTGRLGFKPYEEIRATSFVDMYRKEDSSIDIEFKNSNGYSNVEEVLIPWKSGYLVTVDHDGTVNVWEIASKKVIRTFQDTEKKYNINQVALYNESILLTGCKNGKIKIWNIKTGEMTACFIAHQCAVSGLSVSADRKLIISGGEADGIKIWSFGDFELIASITVLNRRDYAFFTPYNEFFVSDPKFLQFYKDSKVNGTVDRILVTDEKERQTYINYFSDIGKVRARIEEGK